MGKYRDLEAPLVAALSGTPPAPTPDNTPVPGGGSWRWDTTQPGWVENTHQRPLQPFETGALSTDPIQE